MSLVVLLASATVAALTPGAPALPDREAAAASCSRATALEVGKPLYFHPGMANPIGQVLCGQFLGVGSQAMVVTFHAPTCWPVQWWAVYRLSAGKWKLVKQIPSYLEPPLVAIGNDIRETTAVHRAGDARCLPSGGKRSRVWRWNGTAFAPGAWKQVTPGDPLKNYAFRTRYGTECGMTDQPGPYGIGVSCQSYTSAKLGQNVTLDGAGRVKGCRNRSVTVNNCNLGNSGEIPPPLLAVGKQIVVGRFRCRVLAADVECVIAKTGKGFLIGAAGVRVVRP
jgi:hypothetical protein